MSSEFLDFKLKLSQLISSVQKLPPCEQESAVELLSSTLSSELACLITCPETGHFCSTTGTSCSTTGPSCPTTGPSCPTAGPSCPTTGPSCPTTGPSCPTTGPSCSISGSSCPATSPPCPPVSSTAVTCATYITLKQNPLVNTHRNSSSTYSLIESPKVDTPRIKVVQDDIQYSGVRNNQLNPLLLSQSEKIISRSQENSSCSQVCLSYKETETQSQKEGTLRKKVFLLSQTAVRSKRSQLQQLQQSQISPGQISNQYGKTEQTINEGRKIEQLPSISRQKDRKAPTESRVSLQQSEAASKSNICTANEAERKKEFDGHRKDVKYKLEVDKSHKQTTLSFMPKCNSRKKLPKTFAETNDISRQDDSTCSKDECIQQSNEVSSRRNQNDQPILHKMSQTNDHGNAYCRRLSSESKRILQEEDISHYQGFVSREQKCKPLSSRRLSQRSNEPIPTSACQLILKDNSSITDVITIPAIKQCIFDGVAYDDIPFKACSSNSVEFQEECSVDSVDVESIDKPLWEEDKKSSTKDLREARLNLEKSLSLLKKQQQLHFQQKLLNYPGGFSEHFSECDIINRKLLLEYQDEDLPTDSPKYPQYSSYIYKGAHGLDQSLMVMDTGPGHLMKGDLVFNEEIGTPESDLPSDLSEVLDYSVPTRSVKCNLSQPFSPRSADQYEKIQTLGNAVLGETVSNSDLQLNDITEPTDLSLANSFREPYRNSSCILRDIDNNCNDHLTDITSSVSKGCSADESSAVIDNPLDHFAVHFEDYNLRGSIQTCESLKPKWENADKFKFNNRRAVKRKLAVTDCSDGENLSMFNGSIGNLESYIDSSEEGVVYDLSLSAVDTAVKRQQQLTPSSNISHDTPQDLSVISCNTLIRFEETEMLHKQIEVTTKEILVTLPRDNNSLDVQNIPQSPPASSNEHESNSDELDTHVITSALSWNESFMPKNVVATETVYLPAEISMLERDQISCIDTNDELLTISLPDEPHEGELPAYVPSEPSSSLQHVSSNEEDLCSSDDPIHSSSGDNCGNKDEFKQTIKVNRLKYTVKNRSSDIGKRIKDKRKKYEKLNGRYHCSYCDLQFVHKIGVVSHERGHAINCCSVCRHNFSSRKVLRDHCRSSHGVDLPVTSYECDQCGKTFTKRTLLFAHATQHLGRNKVCVKCGEVLATAAALRDHLRQHSTTETPCTLCHLTFSRPQSLSDHIKGHERNACGVCGAACSSRKQLGTHTRTHHGSTDTKHGIKNAKSDSTYTKHGSTDTKHGSKDTKHGSTDTKHGSTDTKHGSKDTKHGSTDTILADNDTVESINDSKPTGLNDVQKVELCIMNTRLSSNAKLRPRSGDSFHQSRYDVVKINDDGYEKARKSKPTLIRNTKDNSDLDRNTKDGSAAGNNTKDSIAADNNTKDSSAADNNTKDSSSADNNTKDSSAADNNTKDSSSADNNTKDSSAADNDAALPTKDTQNNCTVKRAAGKQRLYLYPVHACPHCPREYNRPSLLKEHIALHFGGNTIRCSSCDKTFASKRGHRKHLSTNQHKLNYDKKFQNAINNSLHRSPQQQQKEGVLLTSGDFESFKLENDSQIETSTSSSLHNNLPNYTVVLDKREILDNITATQVKNASNIQDNAQSDAKRILIETSKTEGKKLPLCRKRMRRSSSNVAKATTDPRCIVGDAVSKENVACINATRCGKNNSIFGLFDEDCDVNCNFTKSLIDPLSENAFPRIRDHNTGNKLRDLAASISSEKACNINAPSTILTNGSSSPLTSSALQHMPHEFEKTKLLNNSHNFSLDTKSVLPVQHSPVLSIDTNPIVVTTPDGEDCNTLTPRDTLTMLHCDVCDYSTTRKFSLQRHKDIHENKRRFICEICGKTFRNLLNLKDHHAFIHSDQRNFKCQHCPQTFKNKSSLVRHDRKHSNTRPCVCHCGDTFQRACHLLRHKRLVHNEAPATRSAPNNNNTKSVDTSSHNIVLAIKGNNVDPAVSPVIPNGDNSHRYNSSHVNSKGSSQFVVTDKFSTGEFIQFDISSDKYIIANRDTRGIANSCSEQITPIGGIAATKGDVNTVSNFQFSLNSSEGLKVESLYSSVPEDVLPSDTATRLSSAAVGNVLLTDHHERILQPTMACSNLTTITPVRVSCGSTQTISIPRIPSHQIIHEVNPNVLTVPTNTMQISCGIPDTINNNNSINATGTTTLYTLAGPTALRSTTQLPVRYHIQLVAPVLSTITNCNTDGVTPIK